MITKIERPRNVYTRKPPKEQLRIINQVLSLLEPIPKEEWMVRSFTNTKDKCCSVGHLQRLTSNDPSDYSYNNCTDSNHLQSRSFRVVIDEIARQYMPYDYAQLAIINNTPTRASSASDPKSRVMEHLTKLKTLVKQKINEQH